MTRVQKERFASEAEYDSVKVCRRPFLRRFTSLAHHVPLSQDMYTIDNEVLSRAKQSCIVLHPLPRESALSLQPFFRSPPYSFNDR